MWTNKRIMTVVAIGVSLCIVNAYGINSSGTNLTASTPQAGHEFEGKLTFNQDLPVGLVAGTAEHPKLVEIKSISFETTYGNAWGVFVHVGWLPVIDATWKFKAELLDEQGRVLRHSRDEEIFFTCKASKSGQATMKYIELELDTMQDQGRRHAARFRVHLEPVDEPFDVPESADTKTHTFEVVVVEQANNNPIADAALVVNSAYILNSGYRRHQVVYATDSQGHCEISLATNGLMMMDLDVQNQGFASMTQSWSNSRSSSGSRIPLINLPQRHTFEMLPASPVGGIVQDKDGNAIEAAEVSFSAYLDEASGRISVRRSVRTDANGRWSVEGVPSEMDRILIGLKHPEYGGDHGTNRNLTGEALLNARALKHIETLDKGITVTGKVLDDQGQPVSRATVMLIKRNTILLYTITNSSGDFRFACSGDRNAYDEIPKVVVEAPGYAPALKTIDFEPDPEPLDFRLTRGKTIRCRVVDSEGQPVAGASTVVHPLLKDYQRYGLWLEDTDQQGDFEIPNVPDTDISLTVLKQGYIAVRDYVLVPSENEFTIPMKRALTIQGAVTDAQTKKPIPNFEIATVFSLGDRTRTSNPIVFADGTYEMSFNEALQQTQQLQVSAVGYEQATSKEIKIDEGRHVIDFQLARASDFDEKTAGQPRKQVRPPGPRMITGVVQDEKGVPVSGAVISTRPSLGTETTTNADGTFRFRARRISGSVMTSTRTREETTYLLARQKERNLATAMLLDESADKLEIKLTTGVIFSGKVVDVDGKGIPDADIDLVFWISDMGHGSGSEKLEIDPEGDFEIRAIPPGFRYSVHASANGYGLQNLSVQTSEAGESNIKLDPLVLEIANLSVSGVVVDMDDKPVAGVRVACSGRVQPYRDTQTNADGKFTLNEVCAGNIQISANTPGQTRLYGSVQTEGGATDVKIIISERPSSTQYVPKRPPSLIGKSLPDFENMKIDVSPEQAKDKMLLICFLDMQQRPSRNCLMQLNKRAQELQEKDIAVVAVQASKIEQEKLDEWIKEQNIPFVAGMIEAEEVKTRFAWGVRSLPWLILTDKNHIVSSNGFPLSELDNKIQLAQQ